jgi:hypothetical protein
MQGNLRTIASVTAVALFAVVGCAAAATPAPSPNGTSTSSPSASAASTSLASPSSSALQTRSSFHFIPRLRFEVPSGWTTVEDHDRSYVLGSGTDAIILQADPVIATDERDCEGLAAPGGASTVDWIIATLVNDPRLVIGFRRHVVIGRFEGEGQSIDIQLDPAWTGTCKWSDGKPAALILTVADPPGPFFGIVGPERVRLILLDVRSDAWSGVVSIGIDSVDGSNFDALVSKATPIVESFQFGS